MPHQQLLLKSNSTPKARNFCSRRHGPSIRLLITAAPRPGRTGGPFCQSVGRPSADIRSQSHHRKKNIPKPHGKSPGSAELVRAPRKHPLTPSRTRHEIHAEQTRLTIIWTLHTDPRILEELRRKADSAVCHYVVTGTSHQSRCPGTSLSPSFNHRTALVTGVHLKLALETCCNFDQEAEKLSIGLNFDF